MIGLPQRMLGQESRGLRRKDSTMQSQEQRQYLAMRAHIEQLLASGWQIISRHPLQLRHGRKTCQVLHGMLISDSML